MREITAAAIHLFLESNLGFDPVANAAIFNTMRILKKANRGDTYYENYLWHWDKQGDKFLDYYHLLWKIGSQLPINNIMEIGCRTGISLCQLMSSMRSFDGKRVYLFDLFNDGFISPELIRMNLRTLNLPTDILEFRIGDSRETVPKFAKENSVLFDYILVDGCHDKDVATIDLENVVPLLNHNGILIFDDIAPDGCGLIDVWNDFKKKHEDSMLFLENMHGKGTGLGVKR